MSQNRVKKFQPRAGATVMTLVMFAILVSLGVWQVHRLAWKTQLLASIARDMAQKPLPLPENPDPKALDYHRVTMTGRFLYAHEYLVKPRVMDGVDGFDMIVPFKRVSGGVVFVDRGWASDAVMKKISRPGGIVEVEGIVHAPQKNYFTPENDPPHHNWYWPDIAQMGKDAGLSKVAPVLVTASDKAPGVYPVGGRLRVSIPNDHKQYAIFWFSMSGVLLVIYYLSQLGYVETAGTPEKPAKDAKQQKEQEA